MIRTRPFTRFWPPRRSAQRPKRKGRQLRLEPMEERVLLSVSVLDDFSGMAMAVPIPDKALPPDTHAAVGPMHVVEVVNRRIAWFNKDTGRLVSEQGLADFFGEVGGVRPFDPKVSYDELAERFIVTATQRNVDLGTSDLLIAVSDDWNPQGPWEMHRLDVKDDDNTWCDFPQLGWDADAVYVACNMFRFKDPPGDTTHLSLITIDKSTLLDKDDSTITYTDVDRAWPRFTMQPAIMHGAQPGDPMYFVEVENLTAGNAITVVKMTDKLSAEPTFTDFTVKVPHFENVPPVEQPDGTLFDLRIGLGFRDAAWRSDHLVATHFVGSNTNPKVAQARWYEIDTSGAEPALIQSGEIYQGPGVHTFFSSIDIAPNYDIAMTFQQSSADTGDANGDGLADGYQSMYVTGRKATDPLGTMQTPVLVKAGDANRYHPDVVDPAPYRIGDYSGISIDPDDGTFWAANEYACDECGEGDEFVDPAFVTWGTWIAHFKITADGVLAAASTDGATQDALLAVAPEAVATTAAAEASSVLPPANVLDEFAGMEFSTTVGEIATPPDTNIAVGPNHVVEVVNVRMAFYQKNSGAVIFEKPLAEIFAPLGTPQNRPPLGFLSGFDPKVVYDELAGRFVVTALEVDFNAETSHLLIGVSDDSNPMGNWELHRIDAEDAGKYWADWTALGWDADAYYVTVNMFSWGQINYHHHSVFTFDKSSLLDGNPNTVTYFDVDRNAVHFTMWPARMHGAAPGDPMYFVEDGQGQKIRVTRMTDKLTPDPTFDDFSINVPNHTSLPNPSQPGGGNFHITNIGTRMLSAAWRDDRLVTGHHVGSDGVARARWYELDTSGAAPTLVQSGEIDPGQGIHTYLPSLDIAPNGDLGMSFVQSSSDTGDANGDGFADGYLSMYVTGREASDPLGTMRTPVLVKAGEATYTFSDIADPPPYRVGDYSALVVDPENGTFWAANEFATAAVPPPGYTRPFGNWGTWIANFKIGSDAILAAAGTDGAAQDVLVAPSALLAGDSSGLGMVSSIESDDLILLLQDESASAIADEAVAILGEAQAPLAAEEDDILDAVDRALAELTPEPLDDPLAAELALAHV